MFSVKQIIQSTARVSCSYVQAKNIHRFVFPTLKHYRNCRKKEPLRSAKRNTFLDWNYDAELFAFGKRLNEDFDGSLLRQAFTQRSYIIMEEENQKKVGITDPDIQMKDSRELIEEGDSFMSDYIQIYLEAALPKFPAPGITAIKNHLVSQETLSDISLLLGTSDLIFTEEFPVSQAVLADTLKAIVAALARTDTRRAAHFVRDFVITKLSGEDINEHWIIKEPIAMLSDLLAKSGKKPEPRIIGEVGANTVVPCYRIGIYIDKELFSEGYGETVEVAHEMAARIGLQELFGTTDNMKPIDFKIDGIPRRATENQQIESM